MGSTKHCMPSCLAEGSITQHHTPDPCLMSNPVRQAQAHTLLTGAAATLPLPMRTRNRRLLSLASPSYRMNGLGCSKSCGRCQCRNLAQGIDEYTFVLLISEFPSKTPFLASTQ